MSSSPAVPPAKTSRRSVLGAIRNRILAGLLLSLPFLVTFWIILWLYRALREAVIDPVTRLLIYWISSREQYADVELPGWFTTYLAPVLAVFVVLGTLYLLGIFFRSRIHRLFDWILMQVPVVTTIYSAVRNMIHTLGDQTERQRFQRVVLIPFPHPGAKVPAFVTSTCRDVATGKTIICVYVPTTPVPTSGYMLMLPEEEVTEVSWDLDTTLQAIVSGGITVPETVEYFPVSGMAVAALGDAPRLPAASDTSAAASSAAASEPASDGGEPAGDSREEGS